MKPICVGCARFFRPIKNGFHFIEGMPVDGAVPGNAYPDHWTPYRLWEGDKWRCPGCDAEIVVGVARQPIAEHYQPDFEKAVEHYGPEFQVNDC